MRAHARDGGGFVYSDYNYCPRCNWTGSSSYKHVVEGKWYCSRCADVMARARNERIYVEAMYGIK